MIHLTSFLFIITEVRDLSGTCSLGSPHLYLKSIGPGNTTRFVSIEEYWGTGGSCMSDQSSVQACFGVLVTPFDWFCSHYQHFKLIRGFGTKTFWTLIISNIEWYRIVLDYNLSARTIVDIVWTNDAVSGFLVSEINTKYKLNIVYDLMVIDVRTVLQGRLLTWHVHPWVQRGSPCHKLILGKKQNLYGLLFLLL